MSILEKGAYETTSPSSGKSLGKFIYSKTEGGYKVTRPDGLLCGRFNTAEKAANVACYQAKKQILTINYYRTNDFDTYSKELGNLRINYAILSYEDETYTFASSKEPLSMFKRETAMTSYSGDMGFMAWDSISARILFSNSEDANDAFNGFLKVGDWRTDRSELNEIYNVY